MSRRRFLQISATSVAATTLAGPAGSARGDDSPTPKPSPEKDLPPDAPNVVFIITDQQRWDTVAALGFPWMITPNLDRLVREGVAFTHAYCPAPSCVASRHALMTGYFAPTTGVFSFDSWSGRKDWLQAFGQAGYHMASIGKVHYQPVRDLPAYWDERVVVENKSEGEMPSVHGGKTLDDWGRDIAKKNIPKPMRRDEKYPDFSDRLGAFAWEYDESDQADMWTGDRAVRWIENYQGKAPFFLWVGFPGPHEPYDPPKRFLDMYKGREMPPVSGSYADLGDPGKHEPWETKAYADFIENDSGDHKLALSKATPEGVAETRRHYCANVTAIDEKVGEILAALEQRGILDNTIIVFTSDHGDTLFDHGVPYKWTPYEGSVRVPLIVRYPKAFAKGLRTDRMTSLLDVVPPLFEQASLPVPPGRQWVSASATLAGKPETSPPKYAYCVHGSDQFNPSTWIMVASQKWKYVHYINSESRQLYDLENDPGELKNLAFDRHYAPVRAEMESEALRWFASSTRQGSQVWSAEIR
ncbi:MAG: sulfatase-like hydrolase/transferase [Terrimicrobiaceae bacterium]